MTQEQYQRAVEISKRIEELEDVKREISPASEHYLTYARISTKNICSEYTLRGICEILDRHDLKIRVEIDDKIKALKKEIESL